MSGLGKGLSTKAKCVLQRNVRNRLGSQLQSKSPGTFPTAWNDRAIEVVVSLCDAAKAILRFNVHEKEVKSFSGPCLNRLFPVAVPADPHIRTPECLHGT